MAERLSVGAFDPKMVQEVLSQRRATVLVGQIFETRMRIYRYKYFPTFLGNFFDSLGPAVILIVGGCLVVHGRIEVSTVVVFISGFQMLSDPRDQLIDYYRSISNTRVTYDLVTKTLGNTLNR